MLYSLCCKFFRSRAENQKLTFFGEIIRFELTNCTEVTRLQIFLRKERKSNDHIKTNKVQAALVIRGFDIRGFDYSWTRKQGKTVNREGKSTVLA